MQKIYFYFLSITFLVVTTMHSQHNTTPLLGLFTETFYENKKFFDNEITFYSPLQDHQELNIEFSITNTSSKKNYHLTDDIDSESPLPIEKTLLKLIGPTNTPTFTCYNIIWPYHATEIGYDLFILCRPCEVCSQHLKHR